MSLANHHILITAGPTIEPLDPVRYISNYSSGKQGYAIAKACVGAGAKVTLVSGPVQLEAPKGVTLLSVKTADEMLAACEAALPADIAICVAAVCDWKSATTHTYKLKKRAGQETLLLELTRNPDILATLSRHQSRPKLVIGFAAETENHIEHAREKLNSKGCDWLLVNDVAEGSGTFGGDQTHLRLLRKGVEGVEDFGTLGKDEAAEALLHAITFLLH